MNDLLGCLLGNGEGISTADLSASIEGPARVEMMPDNHNATSQDERRGRERLVILRVIY
jgi:hypothetical protein